MSKLLDRFRYFKQKGDTFADGHGQVMHTNRDWEDSYRQRWQFDKIVRSTHGVNCTGSCSWKIYVKNGLVTWETQQTDYPRTRPDLPNHEPRGCPRGASYSWYLYSANRLKYPLVRKRLIELWREALSRHSDPVLAWESIMNDPQKCQSYKQVRGHGGFIRSNWKELNQLIAAANVWTIKTYGPDRVAGFSPIPAMSMVSYAAGTRYLSLLGGTCLSFYDWYCDLPPASPMTWGEQTDVPESADWYNSAYIIAWGSNVPQTRTPDAHFFTEVRYKGTKTIAITPDYSEVAKLCDQWLAPKMRHYMRSQTVEGVTDTRAIDEVGLSVQQVEEMYRYLAIANYEDRFVIPTSHREMARDAFPERNGCGFTFGDGCHGSDTKFNLFNSSRIDAINITEVRDKAEGE
ncbi:molybdopterin-dependent oxidoreductase [Salmonella enterica]|nr:molybdopterin-dependent oxidoreductase [Salmonella enterica]